MRGKQMIAWKQIRATTVFFRP